MIHIVSEIAQGYRFPAFAPEYGCQAPQADYYAIMENAVQYMLIQRVDDLDDSVLLLPTWPCDWDVDFSLHAPRGTTIVGSLKNGQLEYKVTPQERGAFVKAAQCQQQSQ